MPNNASLEKVLSQYREMRDLEYEECYSRCMEYKERVAKGKKEHSAIKKELKESSRAIISLKENDKYELIAKRLKSQLIAYQILHKKDTECIQNATQKLAKAKLELKEMELENARLRERNEQLAEEYKTLKEGTCNSNIVNRLLTVGKLQCKCDKKQSGKFLRKHSQSSQQEQNQGRFKRCRIKEVV
eukprot:TRINITY_DN12873_c0_g6_i1.p1 TRINITY_DN12873_c0_g6~~TRINITY_DN12873_c0_g6_i1.p1  ORF type:complete len:187 (-),score=40.89 TRINITY_DN12873_c0_g6_i1:237-797(-)